MKREQFKITSNAGHDVIKFKWNRAIREIESIVKELAQNEQTEYELTNSESVKVSFAHVSGLREWTRKDGRVIVFRIEKL